MSAHASNRDDSRRPQALAAADPDARPLIMHVVFRFGAGGLENGIVNLINRLPAAEFRHVVVALTHCDAQFCRRVTRNDVAFLSLHKPKGHGWQVFWPMWQILRKYRPDVVHTRNIAALEMQLPAWLAGVRVRLHGEHGRDKADPLGTNRRHRFMRRVLNAFVTHYVALSADLEHYLTETIGIDPRRVSRICNGVDEEKFRPAQLASRPPAESSNVQPPVVVGTVGRMHAAKGHGVLLEALGLLLGKEPNRRQRLKVRLVGDGPLRPTLEQEIARLGLRGVVELLGERGDVDELMRSFDVLVVPSVEGEGISNQILEAMASGIPVVATAVGGNAELVVPGTTGALVPPNDAGALAAALAEYLGDAARRRREGAGAREAVEARFRLNGMVERYRCLYHEVLSDGRRAAVPLT
jgi:sugar transferase (PEP-CTERM/EpsH1 system associated)